LSYSRPVLSLIVLVAFAWPSAADAADILFVSDGTTDLNIPDVLRANGHSVRVVTNDFAVGDNPTLRGTIAPYDAIFWSATGTGFGDAHTNAAVFTNLSSYASAGGRVFVTGYDATVSPADPNLRGFLGATGGTDIPGPPGAVASVANSLTVGVVDIRGVTPSGYYSDRDSLSGLGLGTVAVVTTASGSGAGEAQWTLRTLGAGQIAFVSNGQFGPDSRHPSWETTTAGGAGAYNAAIRNFAYSAGRANVLFVSDGLSDTNIPAALRADGHTVTEVTNDFVAGSNVRLGTSLAGYDAVFWSATGAGFGDAHTDAAVFTNLTSYVSGGGRVFVTGYDSLASPSDPNLIAFVGATSSTDLPGAPGPVVAAANSLTTGVVDIRGVTPSGYSSDRDSLAGLGADTVAVVTTASGTGAGQAQWTLRHLGAGEVAYVSNGDSGASAHASWTNTSAGGAGAYNAALRNFAEAAASTASILLVSDVNTDANIATALRADGHLVRVVINDYAGGNPTLTGALSGYDAVYWSATGSGAGSTHGSAAVFSNLTSYVNGGGRVLVTGYDSVASPPDPMLLAFVGGTGTTDIPGPVGAVVGAASSLTVGVVDIRGVTPTGGSPDRDTVTGLGADTTGVALTASGSGIGEAQWTLRSSGAGEIAYVSNGEIGPTSGSTTWTNTAAGGAGAYNAAVRNFARAAVNGSPAIGAPSGEACSTDGDCAGGRCVDGVCCNLPCGGGAADDCIACSAAAGAATDGACGALSAATAPTVTCRGAAGGCDVAEACTAGSPVCPGDTVVTAGTECRGVAGACDVAEACDGTSAACPSDTLAAAGTECRTAADLCDAAEACDGGSAACPADAVATAGTECRASAGGCDVAEACDGSGVTCPADTVVAAGTECRAAAGACDVPEACDGSGATCPTDVVVAGGAECRAAAGVCDVPEACDGATAPCPTDMVTADGTACGDGTACNGDETCAAGTCTTGTALDCDDGDACTADMCSEPAGCASTPIDDCCTTDADCDDGDACTADTCDANVCTSTELPDCMPDAGVPDDGGIDDDAAVPPDGAAGTDGGIVPPRGRDDGGCCHVAGAGDRGDSLRGMLSALVLGLALVWRRRRRS
jgi:hypothetical protein